MPRKATPKTVTKKVKAIIHENEPESRRETVVIARCISCKKTKEVRAGEVAPGDMPFCDACGSVCVAERAETRKKR